MAALSIDHLSDLDGTWRGPLRLSLLSFKRHADAGSVEDAGRREWTDSEP